MSTPNMRLLCGLGVLALASFSVQGAELTPDKIFISRAAAKALLESEKAMNPSKGVSFRKLDEAFPGRQQFSVAEVLAIRDGTPKPLPAAPTILSDQTVERPRDAWSEDEVRQRFEALEAINPKQKDLMQRLRQRVPGAKWYTTEQVLNAEAFEEIKDPTPQQWERYRALMRAVQNVRQGRAEARQGLRWPRIRRSWSDVLYDEDQTQPGRREKALSDLEGALFSYARNGKTNTDTWNAHVALVLPITYQSLRRSDANAPQEPLPNAHLWRFALAPSVTYNRVDTSGDPIDEVDSLFYRLGLFYDIYGQSDDAKTGYGLQLRAAAVRVTDHQQDASLNGFEFDLEPRLHTKGFRLGYQMNLWPKRAPVRADGSDISLLEGQLRTWLHMEGGDVQDAGASWKTVDDSFLRLGPSVQLQLAMPCLPGDRTLSFTALYTHFATISGSTEREWYFRTTLAYDFFRDRELNHKVSLNASYEKGGLSFTKEEVDVFSIGLGVLF